MLGGNLFGLQVACPDPASPPNVPCHIAHCGMCYPMGAFDSERCVQAEENEGQSPGQSGGGGREAERCMFHCAPWH